MRWRNTHEGWGLVSIVFHWSFALVIVGLFGVGLYMVDLGYTDPMAKVLPDWHRSVGLLLGGALVLRIAWRLLSPPPPPLPNYQRIEHIMATLMHWALYGLLLAIIVSGYLISTADGRGVAVFGWFEVPAATGSVDNLEDVAGEIHYWLAWTIIVLSSLHALAALKHHLIDHDRTLRRMINPASRESPDFSRRTLHAQKQTRGNNRRAS